jgi:hypothetical protein
MGRGKGRGRRRETVNGKVLLNKPQGEMITLLPFISKMYFRHWKPPGVSERMWSVNLDASISGEYQTLGGHSCRPSE